MPAKKPYADTSLTNFLEKRVLELQPRKSQAEIAREAGFVNANMISLVKSGATRLPLDRVPALAAALEVDPARLLLLALEQWAGSSTARAFESVFGTVVTKNEIEWIREIRAASDHSDPAVTTRTRASLRSLFGR